VNHLPGVLDAICWNAAAASVAQKEAACLRELGGIRGIGDAAAQKEKHGGRDGESSTHGKLQSSASSANKTPEGRARSGNNPAPNADLPPFQCVIFWAFTTVLSLSIHDGTVRCP
jgi:hypothetical protein